MEAEIYHLQVLSALHVGIGQGVGVIDLPIAREKSTHLPVVPGSGLKGVLREELNPGDDDNDTLSKKEWLALFGPDTSDANLHAGALAVGDARLLCLPVRSASGTFAFVTCPFILMRYLRDLQAISPHGGTGLQVPSIADRQEVCTQATAVIKNDQVFLEDLDLNVSKNKIHNEQARRFSEDIARTLFRDDGWQQLFKDRFVVVSDSVFDFLSEAATEIRARVKLCAKTRTVDDGPWYEENLPAETVLWGVLGCDRSRRSGVKASGSELLKMLPGERRLQIGGNATIGRGQTQWILGQRRD